MALKERKMWKIDFQKKKKSPVVRRGKKDDLSKGIQK